MTLERYNLTVGETSMVFEFTSFGPKGPVKKLVIYSNTMHRHFYNLGFGDKHPITGEVDDEVITNNGDSDKVLSTVASTLYIFTDRYPNAIVFATGSTKARTRLYRMGISHYIELTEKDFEVHGLVNTQFWQPFSKNIDYEAFLVKRKKDNFTP